MTYQSFCPSAETADFVECFWSLRPERKEDVVVMPDGRPEIILNLGKPAVETVGGTRTLRPRYSVCGQLRRALRLSVGPDTAMLGIRLQPWAFRGVLGIRAFELTDTAVSLSDVVPELGRKLVVIAEGPEPAGAKIKAMDGVLRQRLRDTRPTMPCVQAVRLLERDAAPVFGDLFRDEGVTLRTWERRFKQEVGINPKLYSRIIRFLRWLRISADADRGTLASLALEAQYFDQAHVHRDARQFADASPGDLVRSSRTSFSPIYDPGRLANIVGSRGDTPVTRVAGPHSRIRDD